MNEWRSQYGTGILVLAMLLTFISAGFTPLALAEPATKAVYKEQPLYEQQPNLPPRIIPIYFVKGTNRQMGYQLGYQTASEIQVSKNKRWLFVMDQCDWDYDEVIRHLKGFQYYIEKFTPEIIDDMIGMAQGCTDAGYPTCYLDILVINVGPWVMFGKSPTAKYPSPISGLPPEALILFCGVLIFLLCIMAAIPTWFILSKFRIPDEDNGALLSILISSVIGVMSGILWGITAYLLGL